MYTTQIIRIFQAIEIIFVVAVSTVFWIGLNNQDTLYGAYEIGLKSGTFAIFFLAATLTPGILKRLGLMRTTMILLTPYKRHLGISTYLLALAHYFLVTLLPSMATNSFPPTITQISFFGFLGLLTMTPLFITSNNISMKKLGRNWARLHKLVYLSGIFILIHVTLQSNTTSILAFIVLFLELASYIKFWFFKPKAIPSTQPQNS